MEEKKDAYAAFRSRDYRWFLLLRICNTLAAQMISVSIGYLIYELTGNPLNLGLIGLAEAVPAISVSLLAGHWADKYSRRNLILMCIGILAFCAALLLWLTWHRFDLPKNVLIAGLYTAIFISGIARGSLSPIMFAFLPQLVDKKHLSNAITWNSSTWEVASISGLGLGGLAYGFLGPETPFMAALALFSFSLYFGWQIPSKPVPPANHNEPVMVRIREGLRFVFSNKLIISSIALDMFAVLFGGAVALLPVFAKDILQVGPQGMGILRAAMSLGAMSTAFVIAHRSLGPNIGKVLLFATAGFGLSMMLFAVSRNFYLSFAALFLAGIFDEVSVFVRASLLQFQTPDHMKGRVSSVNSIFITSSNEIGAFESGLAAKLLGTVPSVIFGGCMTLLVVGITWWKSPKLRNLKSHELEVV